MRLFCFLILATIAGKGFAFSEPRIGPNGMNSSLHLPSTFEVTPLNSPVTEKVAKFLFKLPSDLKIDGVSYRIYGPRLFKLEVRNVKDVKLIDTSNGSELHIPVDSWKPGSYRLFVTVKDKTKKEFQFKKQFKRNHRDYVPFAIAEKPTGVQEPDPVKNNATLLGIDTDNNGIRDDIQLWIASKYKDSPTLHQVFSEYAFHFQNSLRSKDDKLASNLATHAYLKSHQCALILLGEQNLPFQQRIEATRQIEFLHANTKLRIQAIDKVNSNFHGEGSTVLSKEEACEF